MPQLQKSAHVMSLAKMSKRGKSILFHKVKWKRQSDWLMLLKERLRIWWKNPNWLLHFICSHPLDSSVSVRAKNFPPLLSVAVRTVSERHLAINALGENDPQCWAHWLHELTCGMNLTSSSPVKDYQTTCCPCVFYRHTFCTDSELSLGISCDQSNQQVSWD